MIVRKTKKQLEIMLKGGKILGEILDSLLDMIRPGIKLSQIEEEARSQISQAGGKPSFMTVKGYSWATCICINEEVVHGIPTDYEIKLGDVVTIDIGMLYQDYHTDTASTVICSGPGYALNKIDLKFLEVGEMALREAIKAAIPGNRIWDISKSMEEIISKNGCEPVKSLVGHGIGKNLHEPPQIPCFTKGERDKSPLLESGMTIAIEVIYAQGSGDVVYSNEDGWTIATRDASTSAVFEHTIIIDKPPVIVTMRPDKIL